MFDLSERVVSEQDEVSGLETIGWEKHLWKYLSLIGDERVVNLQRTKVSVFSDSVLRLGKILENPLSNDAWVQRLGWLTSSSKYRNFDRIDGEPLEFEWNIFTGFTTLQLSEKVKRLLFRLEKTPENFTRKIIFMSCSTTSSVDQETMKKNACQMLDSFLSVQRDLEQDSGHFLVPVQRTSGSLPVKIVHKVNGTRWRS